MSSLAAFRNARWTVANEDRDFPEWHGYQPCYYFWTIMVDQQDWVGNTRQAARKMAPYLLDHYQRQPHVTILPGGFPGPDPLPSAEICRIARETSRFELELGALGSFTSAACFAVVDVQDSLRQLRSRLREIMVDPASMVRDADYQPHLTIGLYHERFSTELVGKQIQRYTMVPARPLAVGSFLLARYATCTVKGPIEVVAGFELGSGRVTICQSSELFS